MRILGEALKEAQIKGLLCLAKSPIRAKLDAR